MWHMCCMLTSLLVFLYVNFLFALSSFLFVESVEALFGMILKSFKKHAARVLSGFASSFKPNKTLLLVF